MLRHGGGSPPAGTDLPSASAADPSLPPTRRPLRYGPRPLLDRLMSTQRMRIMRWPCYVRDRHAARSRPTARVLARWAATASREVPRPRTARNFGVLFGR